MKFSPFAAAYLLFLSACGGADLKEVQPAMQEMMPLLADLAEVEMVTQNRGGQRIVNYKSVPADSALGGIDASKYVRLTQVLDRSTISIVRTSENGVAFTTNGWIDAESGLVFVRAGNAQQVANQLLGSAVEIAPVRDQLGWYSFFVD